mmetsp:Transcript_23521/g.65285  ORF Transcript_23521/g.65285 Transcript_23521/m.65285 type:complete len:94 (+) Transcript_23521:1976-2257(+)
MSQSREKVATLFRPNLGSTNPFLMHKNVPKKVKGGNGERFKVPCHASPISVSVMRFVERRIDNLSDTLVTEIIFMLPSLVTIGKNVIEREIHF